MEKTTVMEDRVVKVGDWWDGAKHIECFAIEHPSGWEIEKRVTRCMPHVRYQSLNEVAQAVRTLSEGKAVIHELMGEYTAPDGLRLNIYARPLAENLWGVEIEKTGKSEWHPDTFSSLSEIKEMLGSGKLFPANEPSRV